MAGPALRGQVRRRPGELFGAARTLMTRRPDRHCVQTRVPQVSTVNMCCEIRSALATKPEGPTRPTSR